MNKNLESDILDLLSKSNNQNKDVTLNPLFIKYGRDKLSASTTLPWSENLIFLYRKRWNYKILSSNPSIAWSIELLEKYHGNWDWELLSRNQSIPWTTELIKRFRFSLNLESISNIENLSANVEMYLCKEIYYREIGRYIDSFANSALSELQIPWTIKTMEYGIQNFIKWHWGYVVENPYIKWNDELVDRFKDNWDWDKLSEKANLPWSIDFIYKYRNYWNWFYLSSNINLPWSIELIEKLKDYWDWCELSGNLYIPWTQNYLINSFNNNCFEKLPFNKYHSYNNLSKKEVQIRTWNKLSANLLIDWDIKFLNKYQDFFDWNKLSKNPSLPWSLILLKKFESRWDWDILSCDPAINIPWSLELIREFKEKWKWSNDYLRNSWDQFYFSFDEIGEKISPYSCLSTNQRIKWTVDLINEFIDKIDFWLLSLKGRIDFDVVKSFKEKWSISKPYLKYSEGPKDNIEFVIIESTGWRNLSENRSLVWTVEEYLKYKKFPISSKLIVYRGNYELSEDDITYALKV